ncbi:MAG TPA: hypothetical protein VLJ42_06040 [Solirubrobacteraceae bacterium]|nr:hypothetical protein [Solirubrobacteraceae bacterium]
MATSYIFPYIVGPQLNGVRLEDLVVAARTHRRHRLYQVRHRLVHGRGVRGLNLPVLGSSRAPTRRTQLGVLNVTSMPPPRPAAGAFA